MNRILSVVRKHDLRRPRPPAPPCRDRHCSRQQLPNEGRDRQVIRARSRVRLHTNIFKPGDLRQLHTARSIPETPPDEDGIFSNRVCATGSAGAGSRRFDYGFIRVEGAGARTRDLFFHKSNITAGVESGALKLETRVRFRTVVPARTWIVRCGSGSRAPWSARLPRCVQALTDPREP